ncbi:MAG: DUF4382 domain-containing protein [Weeksellaceae bacterium]|nr:DUF4382 domain-containing protein [Weeksellaceae bacterium]
MKKLLLFSGIFALLSFNACTSESSDGGTAKVNVRMTDAPALYDAVNIDVQKVEFNTGNGWQSVNVITPGVYNLLNFKNGMDVLLAQATLPAAPVSQMRLVLGPNNSLVKDGMTYPLATPSAMQSGLKFNWNQTLEANGAYNVWIDFDASKSIVQQGNGNYSLKPVIRTFSELTNGQIKGYLLPQAAKARVLVITPTNDTVATALPNIADGYYMVQGLNAGTYKVTFDADPTTGYLDQTQNNVNVVFGQVNNLGTTTLTQ